MNINASPIYDFGGWIDLAPEFDWGKLDAPVETPGDYEATYQNNY